MHSNNSNITVGTLASSPLVGRKPLLGGLLRFSIGFGVAVCGVEMVEQGIEDLGTANFGFVQGRLWSTGHKGLPAFEVVCPKSTTRAPKLTPSLQISPYLCRIWMDLDKWLQHPKGFGKVPQHVNNKALAELTVGVLPASLCSQIVDCFSI